MNSKTGQMVEQNHLGGYVVGGDPATYYPDLWKWLALDFEFEEGGKIVDVVDVGCGDGIAIKFFNTFLAHFAWGIEGIEQNDPRIYQHDYTLGPFDPSDLDHNDWQAFHKKRIDLIWCCEFVEHIEEEYLPNVLDTFSRSKLILMTHAEPGQQGYHHVNCKPAKYWIDTLKNIGYNLDIDLTMTTRELSRKNLNPYNHYARSGLAFRRQDD